MALRLIGTLGGFSDPETGSPPNITPSEWDAFPDDVQQTPVSDQFIGAIVGCQQWRPGRVRVGRPLLQLRQLQR